MSFERRPANGVYDGTAKVRVLPRTASGDPESRGKFQDGAAAPKVREKRTHCMNGHLYTPETTKLRTRDGSCRQICRICERARKAKDKRKR